MKKRYFIRVPIIGLLGVMFARYFFERYLSLKYLQEFERTYGYEEILQDPHLGRPECYPPEVYQPISCHVLIYEISFKQGEEIIADLREREEVIKLERSDRSSKQGEEMIADSREVIELERKHFDLSSKQVEERIADLRDTEAELYDRPSKYIKFEIPIPRSEQSVYTKREISFESLEENDSYTVRISKRISYY